MSVKPTLLEVHILRKQTVKRTETAAFTKYHHRNLHIGANFDPRARLSSVRPLLRSPHLAPSIAVGKLVRAILFFSS